VTAEERGKKTRRERAPSDGAGDGATAARKAKTTRRLTISSGSHVPNCTALTRLIGADE